jgi:hypothetical protein
MADCMEFSLKPLGVECVDGLEVRKQHPVRILNGWELKTYAIIHSPFREVILLDADNVPIVDPTFLFDSMQFKEAGAIFWPDFGRLDMDHPIWNICGVAYRDEPEFESGQIVVNKERCWKALNLAMWYNEHSDFFYAHILGDKETFHMAFHKCNRPFSMVDTPIDALEDTMCQHDFFGKRIFQHRNMAKWDLFAKNKTIGGFLFEEECRQYLENIKNIWDNDWSRNYFLKPLSEKTHEASMRIINMCFEYHRIGYDVRMMVLLTDGIIGEGAAEREFFWNLKETNNGSLMMEISSYKEITCQLFEDKDGVWRGQWLHGERMPIELVPTGNKIDGTIPTQQKLRGQVEVCR